MFPSNSPLASGTNWMNTTPFVATGNSVLSTYVTLVSVNGAGILTSLQSFTSNTSAGYFQVTVDGVQIFTDLQMSSTGTGSTFSPMIRFKENLTVSMRSSNTSGTSHAASYVLI